MAAALNAAVVLLARAYPSVLETVAASVDPRSPVLPRALFSLAVLQVAVTAVLFHAWALPPALRTLLSDSRLVPGGARSVRRLLLHPALDVQFLVAICPAAFLAVNAGRLGSFLVLAACAVWLLRGLRDASLGRELPEAAHGGLGAKLVRAGLWCLFPAMIPLRFATVPNLLLFGIPCVLIFITAAAIELDREVSSSRHLPEGE